jgi:hypothetical protein
MSPAPSTESQATAPAILAILAEHHGLACSPNARAEMGRAAGAELSLASLVRAAEAFGFETQVGRVASYDDLRELGAFPAIVHLRRRVPEKVLSFRSDGTLDDIGRGGGFAVIHGAEEAGVELESPVEGRYRMTRGELEAAWHGIVMCVGPTDDQERRGDEATPGQVSRWLGGAQSLRGIVGCIGVAALGCWVAKMVGTRATFLVGEVIGAALVASVWATLTTSRCEACVAAARETGLPLAPLGVAYYGALLVAIRVWGLVPFTAGAIFAGAGVHLALLTRLAATQRECRGCTVVAAAAWAAAGLTLGEQGAGWHGIVFLVGALGALGLVPWLVARRAKRLSFLKLSAVRSILGKDSSLSSGAIRLIVYKRESCAACLHVEEKVLPPLEAMLGEGLTIERRDAGSEIPAPTLALFRGERRVAIVGVPDADDLREALAAV